MKKQGTEWALGLAAEGLGPQAHLDDGPSPRTGGSRVCAPDAEHPEIKGTLDTAASKRVRSRGSAGQSTAAAGTLGGGQ